MNPAQRLLIVDDEAGIRYYLAAALGNPALKVNSAASLLDAQLFLSSNEVDLVITDVSLKGPFGSEGLDVAAFVRDQLPDTIPVVLLSSRSDDELDGMARACGAAAWLRKPVRLNTLRKTLRQLGIQIDEPGALS